MKDSIIHDELLAKMDYIIEILRQMHEEFVKSNDLPKYREWLKARKQRKI